jgi:hypothetical protein
MFSSSSDTERTRKRFLAVFSGSLCFITHTLRNSRIAEIRLYSLWGLGGRFYEAFCNTAPDDRFAVYCIYIYR